MKKVFSRSSSFSLALLLVACCWPYRANCEVREPTVDVKFRFSLKETKAGTPDVMTRKDIHPWQYELIWSNEGQWISYERKRWLTVKAEGPRSTLIGYAKLPPGQYRIRNSGSIQYPFRCDTKFRVPSDGTSSLTVDVPHDRRQRLKGKIRLVEKDSGKPLDEVTLHLASEKTPVGVLRRWGNREFIVPMNEVTTSEKGIAEVWVWAGCEDLAFIIQDYRFSGAGSELKRMFSAKELLKGVTWQIGERSVRGKLRVFLKTRDDADIPLEEDVVKALFPNDKGYQFWRLPIFEYESGRDINFDYRVATDVGEFVPEENAFVYRNLKDGQTYIVGKSLELFKSRLLVVDGSRVKFKLDATEVFVGEVVAAASQTEAEDRHKLVVLKGLVVNNTGEPIVGATIRVLGTRGVFTIHSGKQGRFSKALNAGNYHVVLLKKGYEPWSKRVELQGVETRNLRVEVKRLPALVVNIAWEGDQQPRGGQIFVYGSEEERLLANTPINSDGMARIEGMPRGKKLVVFRGYAKANERGFAVGGYLIGTKEVEINEGKDTHIDLKVHHGLSVGVALGEHELNFSEVALLLWADWEGQRVLLGGGRWVKKDAAISRLYIPHPDKYAVEILVPEGEGEGEGEDNYENGNAYWGSSKAEIDTQTRSIRISIDESTEHEFRGPL